MKTRARVIRRSRMILAVVLIALVGMVFLWYRSDQNKKDTSRQLAMNYRDNAHLARDKGDSLKALHWLTEAVILTPDSVSRKNYLLDMNEFWNGYELLRISKHEGVIDGAVFNRDETHILTWSRDKTARLWDIDVDYDFPVELLKLQIAVITGTEFNPATGEITCIDPDRWEKKKAEYLEKAAKHYKSCQYKNANIFHRFYPDIK